MVSVSLEYTGHRWGVEISYSKAGQGNLHPLGDSPTHQLVTLILHGNRINSSAPLALCVFALNLFHIVTPKPAPLGRPRPGRRSGGCRGHQIDKSASRDPTRAGAEWWRGDRASPAC